jgi:leucyl/phenylalanyl-tRNA--protein transferase
LFAESLNEIEYYLYLHNMPIYELHPEFVGFPPRTAFELDMVAVGGDLRTERLLEAYARGIFPWYNEPGNLHWYCPEERCVLPVESVEVSHSMRSIFRKGELTFTMDTAFREVIKACREGVREGQTWIHDEIVESYVRLHKLGVAHSLEVWNKQALVGGLYGVSLGKMFFGESMFSRQSNTSKAALITLCRFLPRIEVDLVDCQVPNDHLLSMGAEVWHRDLFLDTLEAAIQEPTASGSWKEVFAEWNEHAINNSVG